MKKIGDITDSLEPMFNKIGELTKIQRYAIYLGTLGLLIVAFVFMSFKPNMEKISKLKDESDKLKTSLQVASRKAAKLEKKQKEMEAAKAQFEIVRKTLPDDEKIPELLANISQAGRDAGLEFYTFQPAKDINKGFYAEIPIELVFTGRYHSIIMFFDKLSRLPRIVNVRDVNISYGGLKRQGKRRRGKEDKSLGVTILSANCKAVTYKFLDSQQGAGGDGKKKKRKKK